MDTLTRARTCHATTLTCVTDQPTVFIDLTDRLDGIVAHSRVGTGTLTVQTQHTTAGIVDNEHEPLLLADFLAFLARLAPRSAVNHHDDMSRRANVPGDEPLNGYAHCQALLLPTSVTLAIIDGRLALGQWQRVFLAELDGPRSRRLSVVIVGEADL
jgi:secondary thiamine-phosphate synthase enzyme